MTGLDTSRDCEISTATSVSLKNHIIIGYETNLKRSTPTKWTKEDGKYRVQELELGGLDGVALDISSDASTIVGNLLNDNRPEAFLWTDQSGVTRLGDLAGGDFGSSALGISADGKTVVGYGRSKLGREAFLWTDRSGMTGLGDLAGGGFESSAPGISADGKTVLISFRSSEINYACLYNLDSGPEPRMIEDANTKQRMTVAFDVSGDGSIVAGYTNGHNCDKENCRLTTTACLWFKDSRMFRIEDILKEKNDKVIENWCFSEIVAISDNGRTIAGNGINESRDTECYIVNLKDFLSEHE